MNPVDGIITSSYGVRQNPVLKVDELHDGIDIAVDKGTAVAAVKRGIVTEIRYSQTYGNLVKYKTRQGYEIMYAHLEKVIAEVGQEVAPGQVIAISGDSGMVTGPHLHCTIWKDGELLDPMDFIHLPFTEEVETEYLARGIALN